MGTAVIYAFDCDGTLEWGAPKGSVTESDIRCLRYQGHIVAIISDSANCRQAAERLKVSRKTVYDYERGAVKPTIDVAERIIKEFGEEVAKPIDIFNSQDDVLTTRVSNLEGSPADSSLEGMIVERLRASGWKFTHAKRAPLDIAASKNNVKVLLTIPHPNEARKLVTNRAENMVRLAKALMCDSYLVVDRSQKAEAKRVLGEPDKVLTMDELSDLLGDELDLKAASNYREARRW